MSFGVRGVARLLLPRAARHRVSNLVSDRVSRRVRDELRSLARGDEPIIVGPWLGEVGFELLYWVPFLQWAAVTAPLDRARLVVVSRGGTHAWYSRVADGYVDVLDLIAPAAFQARNEQRHAELGEQKQTGITGFDREIIKRVAAQLGLDRYALLHPSRMHALFSAYWWGHRPIEWIERHARFGQFEKPPAGETTSGESLPPGYAAVKFYFNGCFPATAENRAFAARVVRDLAAEGPVVSLATGWRIDDHPAWEEEERLSLTGICAGVAPSKNLGAQTALIAGARVWAGTYGGFSYLAPFLGVPAHAFYSDEAGFSPRHLDLAYRTFDRFGSNLLQLADVREAGSAPLTRAAGR